VTATTIFERPRLTDQAVSHLTGMITSGAWPAGTVLPPEAELAQQFGVSRTVVRECVRVLASRGMLEVRQGRGTSVTPPASWTVTETLALLVKADRSALLRWLEVRTILEVESAALAAQRLTEADRDRLREALRRLEEEAVQPDAYLDADIDFHLAIAQATQNPALVRLLRPVVLPLREHLQETALLAQARSAAAREHRAIGAAVLGGDPAGARAAMAAHLGRVADEIVQIMNGRPAAVPVRQRRAVGRGGTASQ